jgi:uncharacterized RDD family membrane protein YckC
VATPPDPTLTPPAPTPAGLWRRSMSATYEAIVLFGVVVFFGYLFSALLQYRVDPGATRLMDWVFRAWLFAVLGAYFVWFWSRGRRTLPMKTVELRVVDTEGRPLSPARAAWRYLCGWATLLVPAAAASAGGPLWLLLIPAAYGCALFDPLHRTLYDRLSGTRLIVDTTRPTR